MPTANLFTTVSICWETPAGYERDCDVEVDYTFDGEDLRIIKAKPIGTPSGVGEWEFDELVWEAVNQEADQAYAEWEAERGEYLFDLARDRAAESYIPAQGAA